MRYQSTSQPCGGLETTDPLWNFRVRENLREERYRQIRRFVFRTALLVAAGLTVAWMAS